MTQDRTDLKTLDKPEHTPDEVVELEGDHGKIAVKRGEVIEKLDEIAEAVLPEGSVEPQVEAPTEESS
jgi:hypothetical protein